MHKKLLEELCQQQEEKIFKFARRLVPHITREDILQPNDFPELENHPLFRYEEGVLEGLRTAATALRYQERQEKL